MVIFVLRLTVLWFIIYLTTMWLIILAGRLTMTLKQLQDKYRHFDAQKALQPFIDYFYDSLKSYFDSGYIAEHKRSADVPDFPEQYLRCFEWVFTSAHCRMLVCLLAEIQSVTLSAFMDYYFLAKSELNVIERKRNMSKHLLSAV